MSMFELLHLHWLVFYVLKPFLSVEKSSAYAFSFQVQETIVIFAFRRAAAMCMELEPFKHDSNGF